MTPDPTTDDPPIESLLSNVDRCPDCGHSGGGVCLETLIETYGYTSEADGGREFDIRDVPSNADNIPYCCPDGDGFTYIVHPDHTLNEILYSDPQE